MITIIFIIAMSLILTIKVINDVKYARKERERYDNLCREIRVLIKEDKNK